jgi:hypothetical protein
MGRPIFGPSPSINLAYHDALNAMALMSFSGKTKVGYLQPALDLRASIIRNLRNEATGTLRFSSTSPAGGICQSTNGYASSLGTLPEHSASIGVLYTGEKLLPAAFQGLDHWDRFGISSPYASGFALERLLAKNEHVKALRILHQVWETMADESDHNYPGAHREAMDRARQTFQSRRFAGSRLVDMAGVPASKILSRTPPA